MQCVFGIDVSKDSISVAIVIDKILFNETKIPLNQDGFTKLEKLWLLLTIQRLSSKQLAYTPGDFNAS